MKGYFFIHCSFLYNENKSMFYGIFTLDLSEDYMAQVKHLIAKKLNTDDISCIKNLDIDNMNLIEKIMGNRGNITMRDFAKTFNSGKYGQIVALKIPVSENIHFITLMYKSKGIVHSFVAKRGMKNEIEKTFDEITVSKCAKMINGRHRK